MQGKVVQVKKSYSCKSPHVKSVSIIDPDL